MKSLYNFIIKPHETRYDNIRQVDDKELIINTGIEDHKFVSKKAVVVSTPAAFDTDIRCGDTVYVHHNIFRRYYDMKGREKNSSTFFKDELYFCNLDQIYMYNLNTHLDYCFVKPILNKSNLDTNKEQEHFGILKYSNKSLERVGLKPGDLVIFTPYSEFEFIIEGERLYCMKSNDIAVTHEYEGNEEENNPSWAKGSGRTN
jgi:alkylated DNA repair dioxygenase AlkB